jgi:hypothetical protein
MPYRSLMSENDLVTFARQHSAQKLPATLNTYERYFRDFRETATCIFEIGVKQGGSALTWRSYFPNAHVVGLDLRGAPGGEWPDRLSLLMGDQGDPAVLESVADRYGPFDVVIDDGSHRMDHQQLAFETLWPHVKPGGLLIIEDINTSYDPRFQVEGVPTTVDYLTSRLRAFVNTVDKTDVDSVVFGYGTALIVKREAEGRTKRTFLDLKRREARIENIDHLPEAERRALKQQLADQRRPA